MNDFVREFFEDQPELLRRYERNEARYILQLPKNYDTMDIYAEVTEMTKKEALDNLSANLDVF